MENVSCVILAAGNGKRMKSTCPKVLCQVLFQPMIHWIVDALEAAGIHRVCTVVGAGGEQVRAAVPEYEWVEQTERLGTGHAVAQAIPFLALEPADDCLVLYGDMPFIDADIIQRAYRRHKEADADMTLMTSLFADPTGYGRILRDAAGRITGIREQTDCNADEAAIREVNVGVYWFKTDFLIEALGRISPANAQGEYYLTDTVAIAAADGRVLASCEVPPAAAMGANDRAGLLALNNTARDLVLRRLLADGVEIVSADGVMISPNAQLEPGVTVLPGTIIKGASYIGAGAVLGPGAVITDSVIGAGTTVNQSEVERSEVGRGVRIGPFAHIRPDCHIADGVKLGNFVEIKNATIGESTSVAHLTYIGDSDIGSHVNFGCGCVTVNYDGHAKFRTTVGDGCFIGCNVNLIAPVTVADGAYIAAGSTITDDVPADALAIARARQSLKPDWARNRRESWGQL